MSTRLEYLKKVLSIHHSASPLKNKDWYSIAFGIPILKDTDIGNKKYLDLVIKSNGLYYLNETNDLIKIIDYKEKTPLYVFKEEIEADSSFSPLIKDKIKTTIGRLIVNIFIIYPALNDKIGYINAPITPSYLEKIFIDKVKDDNIATDRDISVSEMVNCIDRLYFLSSIAHISNVASTYKAITPPPGIAKIKKELLKKYEGKLSDPVEFTNYEKELEDIDKEYLKDDVAAKHVFNKKSNLARKKMYLDFGDPLDFDKRSIANPILKSLDEGIDTSEDEFYKYVNDSRYGSYSRGSSTELGGYTYKILQRSLAGLTITDKECSTTKGILVSIDDSNYTKLINRYIKDKNIWVHIPDKDTAGKYKSKTVELRSLMYCKSPDNTICYKCMSEEYKNIPNGVTNIASDVSSVILGLFMKLMHVSAISSTNLEVADLLH